jgi:hypothetical protein
MVTYIVYSDVPGEPKSRTEEEMTRAEVCERYPFLADLMADANSFFSYGDADYDIQVEPLDVNGRIK